MLNFIFLMICLDLLEDRGTFLTDSSNLDYKIISATLFVEFLALPVHK